MTSTHRICAFTGRPIPHTDNASVQLTLVDLDENGRATNEIKIYDVLGRIRLEGTIDGLLSDKILNN